MFAFDSLLRPGRLFAQGASDSELNRKAFSRLLGGAVADRAIYLKFEPALDYSPADPADKVAPPKQFRRDCMRNPGHDETTIPLFEADAPRQTALVHWDYLDGPHLIAQQLDSSPPQERGRNGATQVTYKG